MKQVRSRPGPGSPGKHDALMCRIDEPVDIDGGCYYSHGIIALLDQARQQGKRSRDERCGRRERSGERAEEHKAERLVACQDAMGSLERVRD